MSNFFSKIFQSINTHQKKQTILRTAEGAITQLKNSIEYYDQLHICPECGKFVTSGHIMTMCIEMMPHSHKITCPECKCIYTVKYDDAAEEIIREFKQQRKSIVESMEEEYEFRLLLDEELEDLITKAEERRKEKCESVGKEGSPAESKSGSMEIDLSLLQRRLSSTSEMV